MTRGIIMRRFLLILCLSLASTALFAQSEESIDDGKVTVPAAPPTGNKVDGDLDQEISNPKMRADSGSKSKFSGSSVMSYTGGSFSRPFGADRPNLSGVPENQVHTSIDGTLKLRYRTTKNFSIFTGVGLSLYTPFQGNVNSGSRQGQFDLGDPLLGFDYTFARWELQHSADLWATAATSVESLNVGQVASVATGYTLMKAYSFGLHVGLIANAWYNFYGNQPGANPTYAVSNDADVVDVRTLWEITLVPAVEYHFNSTFSLRTLFGYFRWRHLYGDLDDTSLRHLVSYQSFGVGIVVMRDVFLYPNVQVLPGNLSAQFTNVGISSSINVF
jgi:hypothetical protein